MMRSILLALVALPQWGGSLADTHPHAANKSDEFVNIIKDDLRRDNDDYVVPEERSQADPAPPAPPALPSRRVFLSAQPQPSFGQPGPLPQQPRQPGPLPQQPQQPGPLSQQPRQPGPLSQQPRQPGPIPQQPRQPGPPSNQVGQTRRHLEPLPHRPPHKLLLESRRSVNLTEAVTSTTQKLIVYKSHKHLHVNNLKRLLVKRMSPATSPPPTSPTTVSPAPPAVATTAPRPTTAPPTTSRSRPTLPQQKKRGPQRKPVMRQEPGEASSPSPDELDLAPARGLKIAHIRYKGRLCQRNLMNMEGPSYDKSGNEVNPPHHPSNSRGRRFYQTRPPKLVLPRCCNCCKKSVLGCQ